VSASFKRACLPAEPIEAIRFGRDVGRQNLERHVPSQCGVSGTVNRAHPASPQKRDYRVVSETLAGIHREILTEEG